jgi:hypothetical protein
MEWIIAALFIATIAAAALAAAPISRRLRQREVRQAIDQFRLRREALEAKFLELASRLGKPRDVVWKQCDFQRDVTFARERNTGLITAFTSVNVSFEAVEGGDMEEVEHVGLLRDGCAVFHYQNGAWGTGGRVLFNMNPQDALLRFESQYEAVNLLQGAPRCK